jgi:hypothetical protein
LAAAPTLSEDDYQRHRRTLIALLASGNRTRAVRQIDEQPELAEQLQALLRDEDAGPELRSDAYRDLRNRHPVSPHLVTDEEYVILLAAPVFPTDDELRQAASEAFGVAARVEAPLGESPPGPDAEITRRKIVCGEHVILVSWSPGRYVVADADDAGTAADPATRDLLDQHAAWLAIGRIDAPGPLAARETSPLEQLLLLLRHDDWLAVYDNREYRLVAAARFGEAPAEAEPPAESLYLYREQSTSPHAARVQEYVRRSLWRVRDAVEQRQEGDRIEVLVSLGTRNFPAAQWVRVEEADIAAYTGLIARAALLDDAWLFPWLRAGDLIRFHDTWILDWRIVAAGQERQARDEAQEWIARRDASSNEQGELQSVHAPPL